MTDKYNDNHEKFLRFLAESEVDVFKASKWLGKLGYSVKMPPTTKAETRGDHQNHSDFGDIFIEQRVEIKKRSFDFTCAQDYPFQGDVIVCEKKSYDRAKPKPYVYLIFNKNMNHVAVIRSDTSDRWTVKEVHDSRYNEKQQCYFCPLDLIRFCKV